jgi:glutathione S-transferase
MAAAAGPKLYSNERSRSQIISWYARETGTSYVSVELNMGAGEHKAAGMPLET